MNLPARRPTSLLERPQRLGVLPTLPFWNDPAHQQLLRPLVVAIVAPLTPLLLYLQIVLGLPSWTNLAAIFVVPMLIMGLVERKIRRELQRRAVAPEPVADAPESAPRDTWQVVLPVALGSLATFALVLALGLRGPNVLLLLSAGAVAGLALVPRSKPSRALPGAGTSELPPGRPRE